MDFGLQKNHFYSYYITTLLQSTYIILLFNVLKNFDAVVVNIFLVTTLLLKNVVR